MASPGWRQLSRRVLSGSVVSEPLGGRGLQVPSLGSILASSFPFPFPRAALRCPEPSRGGLQLQPPTTAHVLTDTAGNRATQAGQVESNCSHFLALSHPRLQGPVCRSGAQSLGKEGRPSHYSQGGSLVGSLLLELVEPALAGMAARDLWRQKRHPWRPNLF